MQCRSREVIVTLRRRGLAASIQYKPLETIKIMSYIHKVIHSPFVFKRFFHKYIVTSYSICGLFTMNNPAIFIFPILGIKANPIIPQTKIT